MAAVAVGLLVLRVPHAAIFVEAPSASRAVTLNPRSRPAPAAPRKPSWALVAPLVQASSRARQKLRAGQRSQMAERAPLALSAQRKARRFQHQRFSVAALWASLFQKVPLEPKPRACVGLQMPRALRGQRRLTRCLPPCWNPECWPLYLSQRTLAVTTNERSSCLAFESGFQLREQRGPAPRALGQKRQSRSRCCPASGR